MAARTVFSVGSSNRTWEEFLGLLKRYEVQTLADVRRFPQRSRFQHFIREKLEEALKEAGLGYIFLGEELGGFRKEGYQAYVTTPSFQEGILKLEGIAKEARTAFMCAERLPWRCHRRFIGFELAQRGWEVIHLIDEGRVWTPGASFFLDVKDSMV